MTPKVRCLDLAQSFAADAEVDPESWPRPADFVAAAVGAMYAKGGFAQCAETMSVAIAAVAGYRQQKGNHFDRAAGCNLAMAEVPHSASSCGLAAQGILALHFEAVFRMAGTAFGKDLQELQGLVQDLVVAVVVALRAF